MNRFPIYGSCLLLALCVAGPASAQRNPLDAIFGTIFGEPPRPPAEVPGRGSPDLLPPGPPPGARPPATPQGRLPPGAPPGTIQSTPLPAPGEIQQGAAPRGGQSPRQRGPQPANTAPQPGDQVVTAPPAEKIVNPTAVFSGLDKITGRIISFDVAVNETVQFGALQVTPRACYTRAPTETPNTDAFIEVDEVTLQGEVRRIFTGWMFASSPGLHAVEHPIYDVWLTTCKKEPPTVTAGTQTPAKR